MEAVSSPGKKPYALEFRSSVWFVTGVVFLSVLCDLLVYAVIIPVIPFRLEELGYRNPSALTGWLLVVFSLGLLLATPPLAFLAERYWSRRTPLVFAIILLIGSQAMFMEARTFWLMCIARALQGIASATVWVVAFALLCDTVPEARIGQQLGVVMMGLTLGILIAPPVGGALNAKLGYRAPFIFGMIFCVFDLISRLVVIEKDVAARWIRPEPNGDAAEGENVTGTRARSQLSVVKVIVKLGRSKRAFAAFFSVFVYGIIFTGMEPTLPLRLQDLYGFTSLKVGIVYLASVVPSIISTPLAGWIGDKIGAEWVMVGCSLAAVPWLALLAIRGNLALFISSLVIGDFFLAAVVTPVTADLAASAREMEGIGYPHVFGAFNFAYSAASAIGPLIGGQVYAHVKNGWIVLMGLSAGLMFLAALMAAYGSGDNPIWSRLVARSIKRHQPEETAPGQSTTMEKGPGEV